jgi:hypothetical protein
MFSRHIEVHCVFRLDHLSFVITVLCLCELGVPFVVLFELVNAHFDLVNLIDMLILIQMPWFLVCWPIDVFCLDMIFLGIYWASFDLIFLGSLCLLHWGFNLHALTWLLYEMNLMNAFDMRPLGYCSQLINLDSCQFSCSVLEYFSFFDPRLWPKGLLLMFEFVFRLRSIWL